MKKNGSSGFSIVELAIVVSIIGILAALAIPVYNIIVSRSKVSALASDLRVHSESIRRFAMEVGTYPTKTDIENSQFGMTSRLNPYLSTSWFEPTPIGGEFRLRASNMGNGNLRNVFIEVIGSGRNKLTVGYSDLIKLDREIDDGSPGSGFVRVSGKRVRYYLVANN